MRELTEFGERFLLIFTSELVRKQGGADFYRLKKILEKESSLKERIEEYKKRKKSSGDEEDDYERIKKGQDIKKIIQDKNVESSPEAIKQRLSNPRKISPRPKKQVLRVKKARIPPEFRNLRPQAKKREIELGKLDVLANDPNVKEIECKGPDKKIYVKGSMGYQPTQITLEKSEILEILNKFSKESQIPLLEGEYHVAVGDLTITARIKEEKGESSFIIKKISQGKNFPPQRPHP